MVLFGVSITSSGCACSIPIGETKELPSTPVGDLWGVVRLPLLVGVMRSPVPAGLLFGSLSAACLIGFKAWRTFSMRNIGLLMSARWVLVLDELGDQARRLAR